MYFTARRNNRQFNSNTEEVIYKQIDKEIHQLKNQSICCCPNNNDHLSISFLSDDMIRSFFLLRFLD